MRNIFIAVFEVAGCEAAVRHEIHDKKGADREAVRRGLQANGAIADFIEVNNWGLKFRLRGPLKIFGSIHGRFHDLLRFFENFGVPSDEVGIGDIEKFDYLFLGIFDLLIGRKLRRPGV